MAHDFDLFVIGAGSGGVRAARMAAEFGARVGIAEEYRIGGTCVIRGCVPKKLFVYASHFPEEFETCRSFGWTLAEAEFSWKILVENKDKEIDRLNGVYRDNLNKAKVQTFQTRARLSGVNEIILDSDKDRVSAERILIATGGAPFLPQNIVGIEYAITSNEAFHLDELPKRIMVVGGGYIAVEFAGIFNGLGVETILAYRGEEILRGFDDDIRAALHHEIALKGIDVRVGSDPEKIEKDGNSYQVSFKNGSTAQTDLVMFATGRLPNTRDMGLEEAGVELTKNGAVVVDKFSKSTAAEIYAVGDVTDRVNLTPVAIREGSAFARTVFGGEEIEVDHSCVPSAVFSQPQIGAVGLTETAAVEAYGAVDIYESRFRPMKQSFSSSAERILMKLIVEPKTDKVLGVHILGSDAGELIQAIGIAVTMGATKAQFDATMAVHPTAAEELVTMAKPTRRAEK